MTRKDYQLIATAFASARRVVGTDDMTIAIVAELLAESLATENTRFNRDMFLSACTGPKS